MRIFNNDICVKVFASFDFVACRRLKIVTPGHTTLHQYRHCLNPSEPAKLH